jgi:transposase
MVKNAFAEGYGMVQSAKTNAKLRKQNYKRPKHRGRKMTLSETIATIDIAPETEEFDLMLTLGCIGNKMKIHIPLKKNEHFNRYTNWKLAKSVTVHKDNIQFTFTKKVHKKDEGKAIGIDFGINKFIATSERETFGEGYKELLLKLWCKKRRSKAWIKCKEEIKEFIDYHIKHLPYDQLGLIIVEKLDKVHHKMKLKRRLSKNMRRLVSTWAYRYIYDRFFSNCNLNRVRYSQVIPYNNSRTCPISTCGHVDKNNRQSQEQFSCLKCGFSDNADFTSANVALRRALLGTYGSQFQAFKGAFAYV